MKSVAKAAAEAVAEAVAEATKGMSTESEGGVEWGSSESA